MVRSSILFSGASLPHMDSLTMTTPATDTVVSNIDAHDPKWRGNSHQFKDIPPTVQAYIQKQLDLSQIHSALLLPDKHLSVLDLAHCSFPSISPHSFITYAPTNTPFSATKVIMATLNFSLKHPSLHCLLSSYYCHRLSSAGSMECNQSAFPVGKLISTVGHTVLE